MKRILWIIGAIFLASMAGLYLYLAFPKKIEQKVEAPVPVSPTALSYNIDKYHDEGKGEGYSYVVNAQYIKFRGGISASVLEKINTTLQTAENSSISDAKKDFVVPTYEHDAKVEYEYQAEGKANFDLTKLPFVNVLTTRYEYSGGAHGETGQQSFVFDSKTGEIVKLSDLFQKGSDYLGTLSKLSLGMIKKKDPALATYTFAKEGTAPREDNFSVFTLEPNGMHLFFSQYQIAPYSVGISEFVIPYTSLSAILAPEYKALLNNGKL